MPIARHWRETQTKPLRRFVRPLRGWNAGIVISMAIMCGQPGLAQADLGFQPVEQRTAMHWASPSGTTADPSSEPSQLSLAEKLLYGIGSEADPARAEAILLALAANGNTDAKLALGRAYIELPAFAGKASLGVSLLEEVGQKGKPESYTALGNAFLWGTAELKPDAAKAQAYLEKAAAANSADGLRTLGEQLVTGWVLRPDSARGEVILKKLVSEGNAKAKLALGRAYVELPAFKGKAVEGMKLLQEAGERGETESFAVLGNSLLWGTAELQPDATQAQAYLEKAAATNNAEAQRTLAEQLVTGWVLKPDRERGLATLQQLSNKGDRKAQATLGRILLNGEGVKPDRRKGRKLLASTGNAGDLASLEMLGTDLMWNGKSGGDRRMARELLTKAAKGGRHSAWLVLAEGATFRKLDRKGEAAYPVYEREAQKAGIEKIDVLKAQRVMWGIGTKRSTRESVRLLEKASARGNEAALTYLLELVRGGDGYEIPKSTTAAKRYLEKYASALTPVQRAQEMVLIKASTFRSVDSFSSIAATVRGNARLKDPAFLRKLFKINLNLGVYMTQVVLKNRQLYGGSLHGLANRATVAAILEACSGKIDGLNCSGSAIGENVLSQIAGK